MFTAIVTNFLFALALLLIFDLLGHMMFCFLLGSEVELLMVNLLVEMIVFCHDIVFDIFI